MINKLKIPLLIYAVIFISWSIYRKYSNFPEWIDEFIFKPLIWLTPVIFSIKVLKVGSSDYKKSFFKNFIINLSIGVLVGLALNIVLNFGSYLIYGVKINPFNYDLMDFTLNLIISIFTAVTEEAVFRGYFLNVFEVNFKNKFIGIFLSLFLFVFIHLPKVIFQEKYSSIETAQYLLVLTVCGLVYTTIYYYRQSLTASSAAHATWNFLTFVIR